MASVKMKKLREASPNLVLPASIRVPSNVYDPPVAPALPPEPNQQLGSLSTSDFETNLFKIPWPERNASSVSLFKTRKRWRAIDVYVTSTAANPLPTASNEIILSVYVFAIAAGIRTIVATGRVRWSTDAAGTLRETFALPAWVAAARSGGERYEVALHLQQAAAFTRPTGELQVSYVATDEAVEPPPNVGAIWASKTLTTDCKLGAAGLTLMPGPFEVLEVTGALSDAALVNRWAQFFDTLSIGNINGTVPRWSAPMMAIHGGIIGQAIRTPFRFLQAPRLCVSTTSLALTQAADGGVNFLVR